MQVCPLGYGYNMQKIIALLFIIITRSALCADLQLNSLSDGSCWYEFKDSLKVVSFNDKSQYWASIIQIEAELETIIEASLLRPVSFKIQNLELSLHCGAYGASLVTKITSEGVTFCAWSRFEKGKLSLRSLGVIADGRKNMNEFCDGHKWGEFVMGIQSNEIMAQLQLPRWSSIIKEVKLVSDNVIKVVLVKDYEFKEQEVIDQIQANFSGKNLIRYIEFNNYLHPIGEYSQLKN